MANELEKLIVKLEAQNDQYIKELDKADKKLSKFSKNQDTQLEKVSKGFAVAGATIGASLAAITTATLRTTAKFEGLQAQLDSVTGSAEEGAKAFEFIRDFTSKTPFQLDQVTQAFITLQSQGLDPSRRSLTAYGNIAASTGKSLQQFVEAVADASVGEFERLKEFGIKASSEGENVAFTFKGVTTEIKKDSQDIQDFLRNIGETDFAGGIEKQANTLSGIFSNTQDSIEALLFQEGASVESLKGSLKDLNATLTDPQTKQAFDQLASAGINALNQLVQAVTTTTNLFRFLGEEAAAAIGGIAADDVIRLERELGGVEQQLMNINSVIAAGEKATEEGSFFRPSKFTIEQQKAQRAELEAEVAALKEKVKVAKELSGQDRAPVVAPELDFVPGGDLPAGGAAGEEALTKEEKAKQDKQAREFERLVQSLLTEEEAIQQSYDRRLEIILANTEFESEQQTELIARLDAEREEAEQAHQDRLTKIANEGATARQKFEAMTTKQKTAFVLKGLQQMTQGVAQHNKTLFRINKAAAIANAIVNTAQGVTKALADYSPPVSIAMAAVQAAAGFAQIQSIRSTSFEGGGGGTTPSSAGTAATVNGSPIQEGGNNANVEGISQAVPEVNIAFSEGITDTKAVRDFIENEFSEALQDGVKINAVFS